MHRRRVSSVSFLRLASLSRLLLVRGSEGGGAEQKQPQSSYDAAAIWV